MTNSDVCSQNGGDGGGGRNAYVMAKLLLFCLSLAVASGVLILTASLLVTP